MLVSVGQRLVRGILMMQLGGSNVQDYPWFKGLGHSTIRIATNLTWKIASLLLHCRLTIWFKSLTLVVRR